MELKANNVVQLRNGIFGVVSSFNGNPFQIIFKSYTSPVDKYDENLKHKNSTYDIVAVFDGSTIDNPKKVFSTKFTTEGLEQTYQREEDE